VNLSNKSLPPAKKACLELVVALSEQKLALNVVVTLSEQKLALNVVEWVEGVAEGAKDLNRKVTALSLKYNLSSFYIPCLSREYLLGFDTKGSLTANSIFLHVHPLSSAILSASYVQSTTFCADSPL